MTEIRDGFFHHQEGGGALDQFNRLLAGEASLTWDTLFSTTIDEANSAITEAEREY